MIFETARSPVCPIIRSRRSLSANARATSPRLAASAINVIVRPKDWEITRSVVMVAGPAISGMPSGTTPKSSGRLTLVLRRGLHQLTRGQDEEDEPAGDLEVPLADPDRDEDAAPQEEEEQRDNAPGPGRLGGDLLAPVHRDVPAERHEYGGEPDRVDRHEERDEALEEFPDQIHEGTDCKGRS